jgi:hypothetical protein
VAIYITSFGGWTPVYGTSAGAPQWAAMCALANSLRSSSINSAPSLLYSLATSPTSPNYATYYHDITSGNNGAHSAGTGYDLVTGLGSPIGNQIILALAAGAPLQAAQPTFSPPAGTYSTAQTVTISTTTSGATINYTTDGTTPTETHGLSILNGGTIFISRPTDLQAIAFAPGYLDSAVVGAIYTIAPVPNPTFSPAGGTYSSAQTVTISDSFGSATINYTTDGTTPTETHGLSILNGGTIFVSQPTDLQAIAFAPGYLDSAVVDEAYTIDTPIPTAPRIRGSKGARPPSPCP